MLQTLIWFIFTYIVSSLAIFLFAARLTHAKEENAARLSFLTIGLGPITISWFLTRFLGIFPGHSDLFYMILTAVCFSFFLLYGFQKIYLLMHVYRQTVQKLNHLRLPGNRLESLILLIVIVVLFSVFYQSTILPLTSNDPLEYATDARLIYEYRSTDMYPFIETDLRTGFYAPSLHPLGYISLLVWSYMLQGSNEYAGLIKVISPIYALHTLLLLWHVLSSRGSFFGVIGMLLLITTPLYYSMTSICHIDPIRIYTFFLAFVWLCEIVQNGNRRGIPVAGYAVGMSLYSHSIGLLALPYFIFLYFFRSPEPYFRRTLSIIVITVVALLFGGVRYLSNYQKVGALLSDKVAVYEMEKIDYQDYLRQSRGLLTAKDRIVFGVLKGFSKVNRYGSTYWIFGLFLVFYSKTIKNHKGAAIFLGVIILFYVSMVLSLFLGIDEFIKNDRYLLTIQPFVVFGGALFLGNIYEKMVNS